MIIGKIHPGSGLGDQLFSYIITRVIALDKGYDFGFVGKEFFKGKDFMNLDWGKEIDFQYHVLESSGELIIDKPVVFGNGVFTVNKFYYDPEVNFIEDGTIIDGYGAQDERYWDIEKVREWIQIKQELSEPFYDKICVINFRGGEYKSVPELFLTKEYWDKSIQMMKDKGYDDEHFLVTTDDVEEARKFFPNFRIKHESIGDDWTSIVMANDLIISNSAFAIIPALLNPNNPTVIAPKFWAGRNVGEWRRPQNYYKKFTYI